MMTRTLKMAAMAAALAVVPIIGSAANAPTTLNSCVKAFMADLSSKGSGNVKLREAHYVGDTSSSDGNLSVLASSTEVMLTARNAHDNHPIARATCTVNSQGDVLGLRSEPLGFQPF